MGDRAEDPVSPSKPTTLLASLCSVLLLLRRRNALPSLSSSSTSLVTIFDRSLGAAVTLGLSLAILKWVAANHSNSADTNTKTSKRSLTAGDNEQSQLSQSNSISGLPPWLEELIRWILPTSYFSPTIGTDDDDLTTSEEDDEIVVHHGTCHCKSIQFQWEAPRCLPVREGPGKIRFRHTQIAASSFRLLAGSDCLQTYYVVAPSSKGGASFGDFDEFDPSAPQSPAFKASLSDHHVDSFMHKKTSDASGENRKVGAHSFCRRCGVHILFAPSSYSSKLEINVDCSEGDSRQRENGRSNKSVILDHPVDDQSSISKGVALPDQWQSQPHYPPTPTEFKGTLLRHSIFKSQIEESIVTIANTVKYSGQSSEPATIPSDLLLRWDSPVESKPLTTKMQSPDTPSTVATSCDGLSAPVSSHHGQSTGGDASSSFAEDMLSSTSSSSACDGDENAHNDLVSNLAWTEDEQHNNQTTDSSPLSHHSNISADATASISSLTSTTSIANPMLRDQLKYYMSKHISKPKKGKGSNQL